MLFYASQCSFKDFICLFFREVKGERERGRNINMWLPLVHPLLGAWPAKQAYALDWESNWLHFDSQTTTQSLSHTSLGNHVVFIVNIVSRDQQCSLNMCCKKYVVAENSSNFLQTGLLTFIPGARGRYSGSPWAMTLDFRKKAWTAACDHKRYYRNQQTVFPKIRGIYKINVCKHLFDFSCF